MVKRHRRYIVDGRLKLQKGDRVKISKSGRETIMAHYPILVEPSDVGTVESITFDMSENRFFAIVRLHGTKFWMPVSGLIYVG